ncbi:MAG TPA: hypothetical protein VGZ03_06325 [Acidimicrobiales bacterium]|jgi:hypothetical protein|nr:hypothetical protein [Acidimicrobiales bacterium]
MSVLVVATLRANKAAFEKLVAERGDDLRAAAARGKAAGAIHHRFGLGDDGTVIIVDEWNSAESFQAFFGDPEIAGLMEASGVTGPPEVVIVQALDTPDQF